MKTFLRARPGVVAALFLLPSVHLGVRVPAQENLSAPARAAAGREPVASAPAASGAAAGYTAHEWGTFTTVLDSAGKALSWNPYALVEPLPTFVHGPELLKPNWSGTVRMETPVVYVYAERALTLDARVEFPAGQLTEWYPAAELVERGIRWQGVEVRPGLDGPFATTLSGEHYFAARGVAATPLRVGGELEKFLFYRGVGSFEQPLGVRFEGEGAAQTLVLENRGPRPLGRVLLFENRVGAVALHVQAPLPSGASARVARSELRTDGDLSLAPLLALLREHGLFEDEAQAMLATWRRDWFGPGLRAFYVMPRADTDALLPLTLTPPPARLERVLVGRLELLEPELERTFLAAARAVATGSEPAEAMAPLGASLTRFPLALLHARTAEEPAFIGVDRKLQTWMAARAR